MPRTRPLAHASVGHPLRLLAVGSGHGLRLSLLLLLGAAVSGCPGDKVESKQPPARPTVPVAVAPVAQKTMPLQIQAIGTVEASAVVAVKAQVGGELIRIHITEGQDVKKGDLLFSIDPRAYEAALAQADANLARDRGQVQQLRAVIERDQARVSQARAALVRDQAQARNSVVQERRYADLLQRGLIAQEQYDGIRTNAESLAATVRADEADVKSAEDTVRAGEAAVKSAEQAVRADEAAVESAKLLLSYTTIRSPVDGRAGSLMLHQGNVVRVGGTGDSTLLVINQVRPIYVSFTVPQQQLPAINRYMAEGKLQVDAFPAGDPRPARGVVTFTDNAVDPATGTIRLKATFGNAEKKLWPGQFVNVALTLATEEDAIVVPSQAVQTGQQGPYVFVVKSDSTVENRPVVVARTQGSETIITKGLEKGENVVTDGLTRLVAGAKVEVRAAGPRAGGGAPGGGAAGGGPPGGAPGRGAPGGSPAAGGASAGGPSGAAGARSSGAPSAEPPSAGAPAAGAPSGSDSSAAAPSGGRPPAAGRPSGALPPGAAAGGIQPPAGDPPAAAGRTAAPSAGISSPGGLPARAPAAGPPSTAVPSADAPSATAPPGGLPSPGGSPAEPSVGVPPPAARPPVAAPGPPPRAP